MQPMLRSSGRIWPHSGYTILNSGTRSISPGKSSWELSTSQPRATKLHIPLIGPDKIGTRTCHLGLIIRAIVCASGRRLIQQKKCIMYHRLSFRDWARLHPLYRYHSSFDIPTSLYTDFLILITLIYAFYSINSDSILLLTQFLTP